MSLLSRFFARRHFAAILCAVLVPAAGLSACSEAPKLPSPPKSESAQKPDRSSPDASAPEMSDAETPPRTEEPDIATAPPPPPSPVPPAEEMTPGAGPSSGADPSGGSGPSGGSSLGDRNGQGGGATIGRGIGAPRPSAVAPKTAAPEKKEPFEVVPVYYGTDREVEPNTARLEYGSQRAHKLQMGRALVTVPTAHKVPNIERPWVIEIPYFKYKIYEEKEDPAKHFTMQELKALTKDELLAYVKQRIAASKKFKDHAFVFVHGFNTSFDAAVYRTAQIAYDLDFDGAPFVYSWPSGGKIASYTYDRASAEQAEPHLAEFLDFVIKETGAKSISLIAHSMGNEVLLRVLDRMRLEAPAGVHISQVILAAPDVDRDKFTNIATQIASFANGVTLYAASNDRALETSARFWGGVPRAGDVPAGGPLIINGVDTIDVTAVSTETLSLNHSSYAENKRLLNDIKMLLLTGQRPPDKREPYLETVKSAAGTFWRYPSVIPEAAVPTAAVP